MHPRTIEELAVLARRMRREIIEMTTQAGSGHPSSSTSMIDILVVLYFDGVLRHNPQQPDWPDRDRFVLSKGHGVPALYAVLAEAGYFDRELLATLRQFGSPLQGHADRRMTPGVEASTGSLGQGLSIGLGMALGARLDRRDYRVYVLIGDGEADEGQVWEAAMAAAKYRVDNLTAILDFNKYQQTGPVERVMPTLHPLPDKWRAFGWHVVEIDGHNFIQIRAAFDEVRQVRGKPQVIIAHTIKGKGISVVERSDPAGNKYHGVPLKPEEAQEALAALA
ncbi:MAG: transketolase [Chloroflexota bacterium]